MLNARAIAEKLLCAGLIWLSRRNLPHAKGALKLKALQAPVEIIRDPWGVPHIYAQNAQDLFFAQGFVHAQDRLWQMDFQRRVAAGRLSEVLGKEALDADRWIRILGIRRVAERGLALLDPESLGYLEAYAKGVNACIEQEPWPIEFTLLRYRPEPWTAADTLSWVKMCAWSLSYNWETELIRARLIAKLGAERAAQLEPACYKSCPSIVPPGTYAANLGDAALKRAAQARPFTGPPLQAGVGSNNWVISGTRTTSGAPIVANDLHIALALPALLYENHLVGGGFDVIGATFPGVPGVVVGHNGHVSWSLTTSFADVQDLYLEHLRRAEDGRVQYEYQGKWLDATLRREEIRVRGGQTSIEEVIATRHGPIINALLKELPTEQPLALRWAALEPDISMQAVFRMNAAKDCAEFRDALRAWAAPALNIVYADAQGNIAYHLIGKVPVRANGPSLVPVPGWSGEYEWTGYIPFDELPQFSNPPAGYIASANNRIAGDDYPHYISCEYALGDRAKRIVELIQARDKLDLAYSRHMQLDRLSLTARATARYIGQLQIEDPELADVVSLMRSFDGRLEADSPAACVHGVWLWRMIYRTLAGKLGELTKHYAGHGPTPGLTEWSVFGVRSWEWLLEVLADPHSPWFDLGHGETRDDVMRLVLQETVDYLKAKFGPEIHRWAWGKLHTLTCVHPLARTRALKHFFNRGPYPMGGDGSTLWASTTLEVGNDATMVGPAYRFIVDLGNLRDAQAQLMPGQSGRPGDMHYDDQIKSWLDGDYHPMLYAREDVERRARGTLRLAPQDREI